MSHEIPTNEHGMPFIESRGHRWALGCLKPDPNFSAFPDLATKVGAALPQSQWEENSLKDLGFVVRNQLDKSSCCGQATVSCLSAAKMKQARLDKFDTLSATYIYGHINGGRDQGATIGNGMLAVQKYGTCFNSQVPDNVIYLQDFPSDADTTAQRFKALEAYKLNSFEELCSALTLGIPCVSGIAVGRNFVHGDLNSNGIAPLPDVIVGGHALFHLGLKNINGLWVVETLNSWTDQWGMGGYCYLQKAAWNPGYGFPFDSFGIFSVIEDEQDPNDAPPIFAESNTSFIGSDELKD